MKILKDIFQDDLRGTRQKSLWLLNHPLKNYNFREKRVPKQNWQA
jgi:hypothetical protein